MYDYRVGLGKAEDDHRLVKLLNPNGDIDTIGWYYPEKSTIAILRNLSKHFVRRFKGLGVCSLLITDPPTEYETLELRVQDGNKQKVYRIPKLDFYLIADGPFQLNVGVEPQFFVSLEELSEYLTD